MQDTIFNGYHLDYHWMYLVNGTQGTSKFDSRNHSYDGAVSALLVALNRWNSLAPGKWQYWAEV